MIGLSGLAVLISAALIFTVEPIVARLILPIGGGSAGVWNTCLVFFQASLLLGYLYAHELRRLRSPRIQMVCHGAVLGAAALVLPLGLPAYASAPATTPPALWLIWCLIPSIGAPFAALSATAPLVQAWQTRALPGTAANGAWGLYGASNLGSLLALLAYPTLIEPLIGLADQTRLWSLAYLGFIALMALMGRQIWRSAEPDQSAAAVARPPPPGWSARLRWIALAAVPSSLLLGVTGYITTDLAAAPFLWIAPLALYLLTFVLAFRGRAPLAPRSVLVIQAMAVILACVLARPLPQLFLTGLVVHLIAFFFTALVCHQALMARRPDPVHLTDYYLCVSVGGLLGGMFNALAAPAIFNSVVEYPALLILSALARPWGDRKGLARPLPWAALIGCGAITAVIVQLAHSNAAEATATLYVVAALAAVLAVLAFCLRNRAPLFCLASAILIAGSAALPDPIDIVGRWRGFYGVLREARVHESRLGGEVRKLTHGSTLHGAEAVSPAFRCQPLLYYAHETPIGQVMDTAARLKPSLTVGVVGLGAGTLAAYSRPADNFTFFEIDPLVVRIASDPALFSYLSSCAKGPVTQTIGDARLTLQREGDGTFDVLVIDAFSSDSVPTHLLTVEAARLYLSKLNPAGVVVFHLSNRNLDLVGPAQAMALQAGGYARLQRHRQDPKLPPLWESTESAVIMTRTMAGMAPFADDPRWQRPNPGGVAAWTDDRADLMGALLRRLGILGASGG